MNPITPTDLETLRADTPGAAERIHLNNAGAGLMPRPVLQRIVDHLELEARAGGYEASDREAQSVQASYQAVADLVGCRPRNVAFMENATAAFAQALSAIPFERGDVLVTVNEDYISNQLMFLSLVKRFGIRIERVPSVPEGGVDVDAMKAAVRTHRPRLVAMTHVPTNSGLVQPVERVGEICREEGVLYLLDACQSVGQLAVDFEAIGCDFLSTTARKFLRGPRGFGFLIVSDRVLATDLEPLFIDMRGADWTEADRYRTRPTATRFENWEFPYALLLGTGEAARYASAVGLERIEARVKGLAERLRAGLSGAGFRVLDRGAERCGIVTLETPGWEPAALHAAVEERGVNCSISLRSYAVIDFDEKGVEWALRLSPHYYNTDDEVDGAVAVLEELRTGPGG